MKKMKITALKACQMRDTGQTLVKIETDAGLTGYGEAGGPGPMTRAFLKYYEEVLLGKDPLEVDKLYQILMNYQHANRGHVPTTSGVDIALWDITGKFYNRPISQVYRGRFRDWIQMYVNSNGPDNWLDKGACRAWADGVKASPYGYKAVKICKYPIYDYNLHKKFNWEEKRFPLIPPADMRVIIQGYENLREALDPSIDIIVHCHNEFDLPSMLQFARDLENIKPLWLEDPLPILHMESWQSLKKGLPHPNQHRREAGRAVGVLRVHVSRRGRHDAARPGFRRRLLRLLAHRGYGRALCHPNHHAQRRQRAAERHDRPVRRRDAQFRHDRD